MSSLYKRYCTYFYATSIAPHIPEKNCTVFSAMCPWCKERILYNKFTEGSAFGVRNQMATEDFEKLQDITLVFPKRKKHKRLASDVPSDYVKDVPSDYVKDVPSDYVKDVPSDYVKDVPSDYVKDYEESYAIHSDSPKASATLSRRLLQKLLEDKGNVKKGDLSYEIQQVIDSKQLPKSTADCIDAVRNIGNFAAHSLKSTATGQIIDVEPGEAEWNLDTLELLFDDYFVKPADIMRKQNALNQKLQSLGKPPMKTSGP
jgi:hypothetical protein